MPRSFNRALLFTAFVALSAASCGNSATPTKATPIGAGTFVLTEWKITAPAEPIHAGTLTMTVANKGHEPHELVVVRMTDPANLPLKADGSVDEDRIAESDIIGEIEKIAAGKSGTKSFDLPAGN